MDIVLDYTPSPKQVAAHTCPTRVTGYGGAEFGGKTRWLAQESLRMALEYPGIEILLGRYDYSELVAPTQLRDLFFKICPKGLIDGDPYMSPPSWVKIKNIKTIDGRVVNELAGIRSRVTFAGLKDYHPSSEYGCIGIDQAEEVPEANIRLLFGRIRQMLERINAKGEKELYRPPYRMNLTFNPHPNIEWFLKECDKHPKQFTFIQALPQDNPTFTPEFLEDRKVAYTDDQFRRLMLGQWDVFKGQALPEFDRNIHIIEPHTRWMTERWPTARGIDWGLSALTVCEWVTRSPDGDLIFCQEYAEANQPPDVHAKAVAAMSIDMALAGTWIDPRTTQVRDVRKKKVTDYEDDEQWSVFREFRLNGVYCQQAIGKRENRLAAWKHGLKLDPSRRHIVTHQPPAPRVYIMKNCERLIFELPRLQYKDAIQGFADDILKQEDHAYDAGGFVLQHVIETHRAIGPRDKGRVLIGKR